MRFNPRAACAARQFLYPRVVVPVRFQSTHRMRGATQKVPWKVSFATYSWVLLATNMFFLTVLSHSPPSIRYSYFITVFPVHSTFAHIKSYSNKTYSSFSQRFICQTTRKRFPVYRHSSSPARRGCSLPEGSVARRTLYLSLSLSIPSSA